MEVSANFREKNGLKEDETSIGFQVLRSENGEKLGKFYTNLPSMDNLGLGPTESLSTNQTGVVQPAPDN